MAIVVFIRALKLEIKDEVGHDLIVDFFRLYQTDINIGLGQP